MKFLDQLRNSRQKLLDALETNEEDINLDIFKDFYPDDAHFIYELLQNAEDAEATEVKFSLSENCLLFEHDGRSFNEEDVRKITGIGIGTKRDDDDKIGRFGIGFKSVFVYTDSPRIYSPTFSFEISDFVLPNELPNDSSINSLTRFELPFNSSKKSAPTAFAEVSTGLRDISDKTLLYLSNIQLIQWNINDGTEVTLLRIERTDHHIEILKQVTGDVTKSFHYLRFISPAEGLKKQFIGIAFELSHLKGISSFNTEIQLANQFRITPAKPGCVAVYFTAKKENSGLRFHLHAPFVPELSRSSVKNTAANKPLFQQLAALTAESLFKIRDLDLLNREFLAVLPNSDDVIPPSYRCIFESVIKIMKEQSLTPVHLGGHAPANQLLQARAVLKTLLTTEDLTILTEFEEERDWAVGATQKNNNVDRFLRSLNIEEWDIKEFIEVLKEQFNPARSWWNTQIYKRCSGPNKKLKNWLTSKSDEWHQSLYVLLYQELDDKIDQVKDLRIVRLISGKHGVGNECCFSPDFISEELNIPFVAVGTYSSGSNKPEQKKARKFLEAIGVRDVGEREQIEAILEQRYSKKVNIQFNQTYENDLRRFIEFIEENQSVADIFWKYRIFLCKDKQWHLPDKVYLDSPYIETGLRSFYEPLYTNQKNPHPVELSDKYLDFDFSETSLVKFAKAVGVHVELSVSKRSTKYHSERAYLREEKVLRNETHKCIDEDWYIESLDSVLEGSTEELARLIWNTMKNLDENKLIAKYRPNAQCEIREQPSSLILTLKNLPWLPQRKGDFVRPCDAMRDQLLDGFPFDFGWLWLKAVCFEEETDRRIEERQRISEMARKLGFNDDDALNDAQEFAKISPDIRRQILAGHKTPNLPNRKPKNRERRAKKVKEKGQKALQRISEGRTRSVSVNRDAVKEETNQYLRDLYTNSDEVMICQVCKRSLPFKKLADGEYYFEMVEFLPELERHHHQNYLALCPIHAAMYKHANASKDAMKDNFLELEEQELEIILANETATIYFNDTHMFDLDVIIRNENS